jgi:hypothetical protein
MFLIRCSHAGCKAEVWDLEDGSENWVERRGRFYCPEHVAVAEDVPDPPEEVRGFNEPEAGAEQRYLARKAAHPWTAHTFWWLVHNAVAHPLIAFLPLRPFFAFHDWTSRRMHGK